MRNKKEKVKQLKNANGITLVALVVTIIILIILAGISINLVLGENGIVKKAQEASKEQEIAELKEQVQMQIVGKEVEKISKGESITKTELETILSEYGTINYETDGTTIKSITTEKGHEIKVTEIWNGKLSSEGPITYTAYTRGQEVTIGTETFYVLEDSDQTKETVTLFAKYNLNKAGTTQVNAPYGDTGCVFSTSNYWKDENSDVTPKFNLNEYDAVIQDTGSAVYKAKSYATTLLGGNAKGRLLTYEEAIALKSAITTDETGKIAEMLWEQANTQSNVYYWLGSANGYDSVCAVRGDYESVGSISFINGYDRFGVRPVIEILKSEI